MIHLIKLAQELSSGIRKFVVKAPLVTRKCQPGQFVIVRDGCSVNADILEFNTSI